MTVDDFDSYAKSYDLLHGQYDEDIKFYICEAKKASGKVLEIACGTGRIYLRMLKEGIDAYGIDISNEMLQRLRTKAKTMGLEAKVELADMRTLEMHKKFDLIIIPFRAFLHNITIEDQLNSLKSFRKHLNKGGKLIMNYFYPDPEFMHNHYGKEVMKEREVDGEKYRNYSKTTVISQPDQVIHCTTKMTIGNKTISDSNFRLAYIYKREKELLLRLSGYSKWKVYGGFKYETLTKPNQEMVWVINK